MLLLEEGRPNHCFLFVTLSLLSCGLLRHIQKFHLIVSLVFWGVFIQINLSVAAVDIAKQICDMTLSEVGSLLAFKHLYPPNF